MTKAKLEGLKANGTVIYGCSDDLVEVEGEVQGEIDSYGSDEKERGILLVFSDGTQLEVKYGKGDSSIWQITVLKTGTLLKKVISCESDEDEIYSDVAVFNKGLRGAVYATDWGKFK